MRQRVLRLIGLGLCVAVGCGVLGGMKWSSDRSRQRAACTAEVKASYEECLDSLRYLRLPPDLLNGVSSACRSRFEQDLASCAIR